MFDNFELDTEESYEESDPGDAGAVTDDEFPGLADELHEPRLSSIFLGHGDVESELLEYWNSGKMPHALIFSGLKGIGKATMAFRLARFVLRNGKGEAADAAGPGLFGDDLPEAKPESLDLQAEDPVFRRVASGGHADLLVIERPVDERSGSRKSTIPVDLVRQVNPFLHKTASEGGWRVVVVDDADMMNRSGQNAILKILEEPPEKALLILVAHRAGTLLPTIRSRCRMVNFQPLPKENFSTLIKIEHDDLYQQDIDILYSIAEGSAGQGLRILEEGGLDTVDNILDLMSAWPNWDWPKIHALADTMGRRGQERNLKAFQDICLWIVETFTRHKARNNTLPDILDQPATQELYSDFSLADWLDKGQKLRRHYEKIDRANLDNRQAVIGTFTILQK